jgi:hypothetical protein
MENGECIFRNVKADKFRGDLLGAAKEDGLPSPGFRRVADVLTMYQTRVGVQLENFDLILFVVGSSE